MFPEQRTTLIGRENINTQHSANNLHRHHPFTYTQLFLSIDIQLGALMKGQQKKVFTSFSHQPNQHRREGNSAIIQTLTQTGRPATGSKKTPCQISFIIVVCSCLRIGATLLRSYSGLREKRERDSERQTERERRGAGGGETLHHMPNKSLSANL